MANFCTSCAAPLGSGTKFCASCGAAVEATPAIAAPSAIETGTFSPAAATSRYPALRIISVILKILAVVAVLGAVLSALSAMSLPSSFGIGLAGSVVGGFIVILGLCYGLFLWASAEMIHVLIDIEENTRRSAAAVA